MMQPAPWTDEPSSSSMPAMPHDDVRFRGKPLDMLTREEAIEGLRQAITEVKRLHEMFRF